MNIPSIISEIHSFFAYVFLISCIISIGYAIYGYFTKERFGSTQFVMARIVFISAHIQLLLGIILWFAQGYLDLFQHNIQMVMTSPAIRLTAVEHPMMNIIGITLVTIGFILMKRKKESKEKNLTIIIFYGLALVLILSRIPWNLWLT